jgi:hypothetical protein
VSFLRALLLGLCFGLLALPPTARGDGDPASDVLVTSDVFYPSPLPSLGPESRLSRAVRTVLAKHNLVKVAVIESVSDLGSVQSLFGQPQDYAKFLSLELRNVYSGALLVVMPQGLGYYNPHGPSAPAMTTLGDIVVGDPSANGLTSTAAVAVDALDAAGVLHYTDTKPPQVHVLPAAGRRGATMQLRYWSFDDSGHAAVATSVTRGTKVLASFRTSIKSVSPALVSQFNWNVPATIAPGPATFCARATDGAGHKSNKACTVIQIM